MKAASWKKGFPDFSHGGCQPEEDCSGRRWQMGQTQKQEYLQQYRAAQKAYLQQDYEAAAGDIEQLMVAFPEDANAVLLKGHIYLGLQQYDVARSAYESVRLLTSDAELVDYALQGIENVQEESDSNTFSQFAGSDQGQVIGTSTSAMVSPAIDPEAQEYGAEQGDHQFFSQFEDKSDPTEDTFPEDWENPFVSQQGDDEDTGTRLEARDSLADESFRSGGMGDRVHTLSFDLSGDPEDEENTNDAINASTETPDLSDLDTNWYVDFSGSSDHPENPSSERTNLPMGTESDDIAFSSSFTAMEVEARREPETQDFLDEFAQVSGLSQTENPPAFESTEEALSQLDSAEVLGFDLSLAGGSSGSQVPEEEESVPSELSTLLKVGSHVDGALTVTVKQGWFAPFANAALGTKRLILAGVVGLVSAGAIAGTTAIHSQGIRDGEERPWFLALVAGISAGMATYGFGGIADGQAKRSIIDLKNQLHAAAQGNLQARATVFAKDELGQLSSEFNQMAQAAFTSTLKTQRKIQEERQTKDDFQAQVVRLLDDMQGVARGDLTVQAEVTANVLGAVADSFNLTNQKLAKILQQVKTMAREVNRVSVDNETSARSVSSDTLRQAQELLTALNSVQVLTDSIQRVAEKARETKESAHLMSSSALNGGKAVEQTASNVFKVRETIAAVTRQVKRLAEASQEISKIASFTSSIAARTNMLALNAGIVAARASGTGRGYSVVADEVRQLADQVAKGSKEIGQIVLKVQGQTGLVMTAMEEGTQQIIESNRLAQKAKRDLDDIIQVSNRLDTLAQSVMVDTTRQVETAHTVAQVMQSSASTAQKTSQIAQQTSSSLQELVSTSHRLSAAVEQFRVETTEPVSP